MDLQSLGKNPFLHLPSSGGSRCSLTVAASVPSLTPWSHCLLLLSHKILYLLRTFTIGFRAHPDPYLNILNWLTSAKTLSPVSSHLQVPGVMMQSYLFWGDTIQSTMGLLWWLRDRESACNAGDSGDADSISRSGRSPEGGHGNSLQYSCLETPHGQRSLMGYSPWGHKELDTTEATEHTCMHTSNPLYSPKHKTGRGSEKMKLYE